MIDHDRITLFRKDMIRCGLALSTNGCWKITQLFQHLQNVIEGNHMRFSGIAVQ